MDLSKKIASLHIQAKSFTRVFYSPKPFSSFTGNRQPEAKREYQKPKGLWYECDKGWKEFVQRDYRGAMGAYKHKYALEVNLNRMCVIRTEKEMRKFHREYSYKANSYDVVPNAIDWEAVSRDYDGIEICPYQYKFRMEYSWYYPWDVASGCIWGRGAFKNAVEIENDILDEEFKSTYEDWD